MTDERFTVDDVMRAGGCPSGIRRWFTGRKDDLPPEMDLRRFLKDGMPMDLATDLDDPFINRALALKELDRGR